VTGGSEGWRGGEGGGDWGGGREGEGCEWGGRGWRGPSLGLANLFILRSHNNSRPPLVPRS